MNSLQNSLNDSLLTGSQTADPALTPAPVPSAAPASSMQSPAFAPTAAPEPTAPTWPVQTFQEPSSQGNVSDQSWTQAPPTAPVLPQPPAAEAPEPAPAADLDSVDPNTVDSNSLPNPGPNLDYLPTPIKEELIVDWMAPSRVFKPRQRNTYATLGAMVFLISLILFFLNQFLLIAVAVALAFLYYVLNTVPPSQVKNQLTTFGVRVENNLYFWEELGRFWITTKDGHDLLHIEVGRWPFQLTLIIDELDPQEMTNFLSQLLVNQKPAPTFFDKAADWIEQNIPLETPPPPPPQPNEQ